MKDPNCQLPLQDMHREFVCWIDQAEMQRLLGLGAAVTYGTKTKIHGVRLIIGLSKVVGYEFSDRPLVPANYSGTRYVFRQKISTEQVNGYVFRFKRLHTTESPEHSLLRIMSNPALESGKHQLRAQCSPDELASDPGAERRKNNREIFTISAGLKPRRARYADAPARTTSRLRPPIPAREGTA